MKVIDLLNKIATYGELPEIIKVMDDTYYLCKNDLSGCCYFSKKQGLGGDKLCFDTSEMNKEVEIIEDIQKEDKKIEKFVFGKIEDQEHYNIKEKINEIIDKINGGENEKNNDTNNL